MKKIRVLHVITGLGTGGAEMMLFKLLKESNKSQFEYLVLSLKDEGAIGKSIKDLGIEVISLGQLKKFSNLIYMIKYVKQFSPNIIQGWMYHGNLFALIISSIFDRRIPILWNIRGSHYDLKKEKILTAFIIWLGAKLSFLPEGIINNSKVSMENHKKVLGYNNKNILIIPNGFHTELFRPSLESRKKFREIMGFSESDFLISLIGRYHSVKGYDLFIKAANQLVNKKGYSKNIRFILIGTNVDYSNDVLIRDIKKYNLESYFHLLGERKNLHNIMPSLDIVVSSSYSEGFSNVIGEAMSCGVPCVVTDVGDSKWIVGDTGIVVPPNNVEALVDGIEYMLNLPKTEREKMGMAARKRIIDNFSIDLIVKKYEALYKEIISNRRMI